MIVLIENRNYKLIYRIFSRISREILDKIQPKFYQFDLYARGSQIIPPKMYQNFTSQMYQNYFMCVSEPSIHKNKAWEFSNFGHFLPHFFSIRLIRGSTSIYGILEICFFCYKGIKNEGRVLYSSPGLSTPFYPS